MANLFRCGGESTKYGQITGYVKGTTQRIELGYRPSSLMCYVTQSIITTAGVAVMIFDKKISTTKYKMVHASSIPAYIGLHDLGVGFMPYNVLSIDDTGFSIMVNDVDQYGNIFYSASR